MSLTGRDWVKLNQLLDQALDLEPAQRSQWMDSLPPEYETLRATLRNLLLRPSGVETAEVLRKAPAFPVDAAAAGEMIGPYRLIREIGRGGMSTVWLAERADGSMQRRVALKLPSVHGLDPQLAERLSRERDILASLEHPGIARLYDAGVHEGRRPYLALEYVDGVPLDIYVARRTLSVRDRLALFEHVARAVAYAHTRLIVHRDLKPSNILVREGGEVLLLDFGIARLLLPDPHDSNAVRAFTPRYAAPEQFAGEEPTVATDIYSLGVVLFELLAGRSPYEVRGETVCLASLPLLDAVDKRQARELGRDLASIVAKALATRAQDRYATIGEFLDDVTRFRRHKPVQSMPDTLIYRSRKFVRRYQTAVGLGAALLIAVVVGASMFVRQAGLAVRERDRAVQMLEQASATNEFWNTVLSEGMTNDESVSMPELLKRSEAMAEQAAESSPLQYAVAIDSIASLYLSYGLPGRAEALLSRTLDQYEGLDEGEHVMCRLRCAHALAIGSLGRTQEADAIFGEVLQGVRNEPSVKQYCLQSWAVVANENLDVVNALKYVQEAQHLQLASPVRSPWQSAQLEGELAYAYVVNGKTDLAEQYYESAWRRFEAIGRDESHVAVSVLNGWGILDLARGDPAASLARFDRAIEIARKRSPDGQPPPDLAFNRAIALATLGRADEAEQQLDHMHARALADGNVQLSAAAVAARADSRIRRGDLAGARKQLDDMTATERETLGADTAPMRRVAIVWAHLSAGEGDFAAADAILTQTIQAFENTGAIIRRRVLAFITHADVLLAMGRKDAALKEAQRAVDMAVLLRGKHEYSDLVGLAKMSQGRIALAKGDRATAAAVLQSALEQLRRTLGDEHPDTQAAARLAAPIT